MGTIFAVPLTREQAAWITEQAKAAGTDEFRFIAQLIDRAREGAAQP